MPENVNNEREYRTSNWLTSKGKENLVKTVKSVVSFYELASSVCLCPCTLHVSCIINAHTLYTHTRNLLWRYKDDRTMIQVIFTFNKHSRNFHVLYTFSLVCYSIPSSIWCVSLCVFKYSTTESIKYTSWREKKRKGRSLLSSCLPLILVRTKFLPVANCLGSLPPALSGP